MQTKGCLIILSLNTIARQARSCARGRCSQGGGSLPAGPRPFLWRAAHCLGVLPGNAQDPLSFDFTRSQSWQPSGRLISRRPRSSLGRAFNMLSSCCGSAYSLSSWLPQLCLPFVKNSTRYQSFAVRALVSGPLKHHFLASGICRSGRGLRGAWYGHLLSRGGAQDCDPGHPPGKL